MRGKVNLVGAGPGDYGLMTLKGLACIQEADVMVYDRLANEDYLKEAKVGCEFIYVGKASSNHTLTQDEINEVIVAKAKEGKTVTRLKGGDPYVFGRGGEEGEYLLENGIPFEVVPGITSAIGGLCYAGIPITHRDYTSSFHVVTGHLKDDEKSSINWNALAHMGGTIVFLMGVSNLEKICHNLVAEGMSSEMDVAIINWATRANQKVVTGNLGTICEVAKREKVTSPSLIVVGEVVKLREKLNFFEQKPLFGKTIMTTRARSQSSRLRQKLQDLGASVIEFPTIRIEEIQPNQELEQAIERLSDYTYLIFTSQNTVEIFFEKLYAKGLDARKLSHMKLVAVGQATGDRMKKYGVIADIIPPRFVAESIYETLKDKLTKSDKILMPKAEKTRELLGKSLAAICEVSEVCVYRTVLEEGPKEEILEKLKQGQIDYITFTSSSTVTNLLELLGKENSELLNGSKLISIGEITSETMELMGLQVYAMPEQFTLDEMITCIVSDNLK
ncbi:MAG: uroporphyrinogen-III C-methyltransferase [Cellulosilyticaceae bacterium]